MSFLEAAILIVAPVDGLRPSRDGYLKLAEARYAGSAPDRAASEISLNTLSTIAL